MSCVLSDVPNRICARNVVSTRWFCGSSQNSSITFCTLFDFARGFGTPRPNANSLRSSTDTPASGSVSHVWRASSAQRRRCMYVGSAGRPAAKLNET